jgi:hypothetical protein
MQDSYDPRTVEGEAQGFWEDKHSFRAEEKPGKPLHESLMSLLKNCIEPESWEGIGGRGTIQYFPLGMALVVNQTEDIQKGVAALLADLRKAQDVEVAVEVKVLHVPLECAKQFNALPPPCEGNRTKVQMLPDRVQERITLARKDIFA